MARIKREGMMHDQIMFVSSYAHAQFQAQEMDMARQEWKYISDNNQIKGFEINERCPFLFIGPDVNQNIVVSRIRSMTTTNKTDELKACREAFEAWYVECGYNPSQLTGDTHVEGMWEGWQAAWNSRTEPEITDKDR